MPVKIEAQLLPGKKVSLLHCPSQTAINTAAPIDNNGDGSSFSPTDLVAAALVSCTLTVMGIVAERNNYDLTGTKAVIEKSMHPAPRRISELSLEFHLPANLSEEARKKLENTAHTCPVYHSLLEEITISMKFSYDL